MTLTVHVCSREEAAAILCSPAEREDVCFVVSIGEIDDLPPAGFGSVREKIRLHFADSLDEETGPREADVERLIAAARALDRRSGRVIVHCQAGISRSSAAAVILHTVLLGPESEEEAMARVMENRPIARPNRRMIEIADRLLGRGGRLIAAVQAAMS